MPSAAAENGLDYTVMSNVLLNPNTSTPPEMSEALYYINEMSTPEGFDLIAEDIFASLEERDRTIPNGGRLSKASFQIKFSDSKTPRTVTLSSGNRAQFKRDDDAEILEEWLICRGFIIVDSEDDGE